MRKGNCSYFAPAATTGATAAPITQATLRPCGCLVRNCILVFCFSCLALSSFALPLGDLRQSYDAQTDDLRLIRGKTKRNCETGPAYGCIEDLSWDLGTGVKVDAKGSTEGTMIFMWMLLSWEQSYFSQGERKHRNTVRAMCLDVKT